MTVPQPFDDRTASSRIQLRRGANVEVRTNFEGEWAAGYEVIGADGQGVRVRRRSDGYEIPRSFTPADIRPHKR